MTRESKSRLVCAGAVVALAVAAVASASAPNRTISLDKYSNGTSQHKTQVEPDNAAAHAERGRFYARYGNRTAAIDSLHRALELDPNAPGVELTLESLEGRSQTAAR